MSAVPKSRPAPAEADAHSPLSRPQPPRTGPSRRRRRANNRMGKLLALCAMAAWGVVVLMPIVAALYAIYGY